jgi:hypothetical protein
MFYFVHKIQCISWWTGRLHIIENIIETCVSVGLKFKFQRQRDLDLNMIHNKLLNLVDLLLGLSCGNEDSEEIFIKTSVEFLRFTQHYIQEYITVHCLRSEIIKFVFC